MLAIYSWRCKVFWIYFLAFEWTSISQSAFEHRSKCKCKCLWHGFANGQWLCFSSQLTYLSKLTKYSHSISVFDFFLQDWISSMTRCCKIEVTSLLLLTVSCRGNTTTAVAVVAVVIVVFGAKNYLTSFAIFSSKYLRFVSTAVWPDV